jgi:hypothetical protein
MGKDIASIEVWARLNTLDKGEQYTHDSKRWAELVNRLYALTEEFTDIEASVR